MLLFELVNSQTATGRMETDNRKKNTTQKIFGEYLEQADSELTDLYHFIENFILDLGDDVQVKELKHYKAYNRIKTFVRLKIKPQARHILLYLRLDPAKENLEDELLKDVGSTGHYGACGLELKISTTDDFEQRKALIIKSYEMV